MPPRVPVAGAPRREAGWDGRDPGGIDPRDPRWSGRDSGAPARRPRGAQEARRAHASPRRENPPPGRRGRFGSLQGGLGVCLIVASAAIGAVATMMTGHAPGFLLGAFVSIGTVVAALAVRPRAGRLIFPVPVLAYLVAALISGIIYNRSDDSSKAAVAIGAAQWIANGFVAMAFATAAAIVLIAVRWYFWRRKRKGARPGPGRRPQPDPATAARSAAGYPANYRDQGRRPDSAGAGNWNDERPAVPGYGRPRPPAPGSGPYNFSSGA
jgi:hypothetical protein